MFRKVYVCEKTNGPQKILKPPKLSYKDESCCYASLLDGTCTSKRVHYSCIIDFDFAPAAATFGLRRQSQQLFVFISLAEVPKILIQVVCYTLMFNKLKSLQGYNKRHGQRALKLVLLTFVLFYML